MVKLPKFYSAGMPSEINVLIDEPLLKFYTSKKTNLSRRINDLLYIDACYGNPNGPVSPTSQAAVERWKKKRTRRGKKHYNAHKTEYTTRNKKHKQDLRAYIKEFRESRACDKCGLSGQAIRLVFHHLNPSTKKFNVAAAMQYNASWKDLHKEIAKCILLCPNCHSKADKQS